MNAVCGLSDVWITPFLGKSLCCAKLSFTDELKSFHLQLQYDSCLFKMPLHFDYGNK